MFVMPRRYPETRKPPDLTDDGSGLEECCNGDIDALIRAVEHIDRMQVTDRYREWVARRTAVVREAKARRLARGRLGTDLACDELDALTADLED